MAARRKPVPTLFTRRLTLKPLILADHEAVQATFPQWEIVRYLSSAVPWPYPPDGALTFIRDVALPAIEAGLAWSWTIRLTTEPARLVGLISLRDETNDNRGFWLIPELRRQGMMTEASEAVTRYWFEDLGRPMLRVPKAIENTGSRRISEREGMRVIAVEERDYVAGCLPAELWELTAEEWRARGPTDAPDETFGAKRRQSRPRARRVPSRCKSAAPAPSSPR